MRIYLSPEALEKYPNQLKALVGESALHSENGKKGVIVDATVDNDMEILKLVGPLGYTLDGLQ